MAPVTALSGQTKGKSQPVPELVSAFDAIKRLIVENVLLAFPDPKIPFDVHADASDLLRLGAVIEQQNVTAVAFFLQKLSSALLKCPAVDEEMFCIFDALKELTSTLITFISLATPSHPIAS